MTLSDYISHCNTLVEGMLDRVLPSEQTAPATVHKAMRYSIFAGGKRLRPVLCLAAAEACGGAAEQALLPACAVEMIHTYSLIHDDLPAMDNDDLRRGKPTNHKIFGEGIAILAGDALLTEAFAVMAQMQSTERYSTVDFIKELAETSGSKKLIGGQILDLEGEGAQLTEPQLTEPQLRAIHEGKTAALLTTGLRFGGMSADAAPEELTALTTFGYNLGLAFQVVDDILDVTSTTETMGKTVGKDENAQKSTYPALMGLDGAKEEASRLTQAAMDSLKVFTPERRARLEELANYLLGRTN